jgi:hypothetical protein
VSLRAFQAYLGMSYKLKQSGDKLCKKFLGSDLVRSHLYMWAVDNIRKPDGDFRPADFVTKSEKGQFIHAFTPKDLYGECSLFRLSTPIGWELNKKLVELAYDGVEGSDKVIRVMFRATALLYRELCKELIVS